MNISGMILLEYDKVRNRRTGLKNIPVALQVQQENVLTETVTSLGAVVKTDKNGYFVFTDVPAGAYRISEAWGISNEESGTVSFIGAEEITITPAIPDRSAFSDLIENVSVDSLSPHSVYVTVTKSDITDIVFLNQFVREDLSSLESATSFIQITTQCSDWVENKGILKLNDNIFQNGNSISHTPSKSEIQLEGDTTYLVQYCSTVRYNGNSRMGEIHIELSLNERIHPGGGAYAVSLEGTPTNLSGLAIIKTKPFEASILTLTNQSGMKACFSNTTIVITQLE